MVIRGAREQSKGSQKVVEQLKSPVNYPLFVIPEPLVIESLNLWFRRYPERLLGWKKFARYWTFISQFYTHQSTTFWRKQNFLTRAFFSTDQLVVLPYKAKWHLRGEITKGSTFSSDRMLWNHSYSISLYPTSEKNVVIFWIHTVIESGGAKERRTLFHS